MDNQRDLLQVVHCLKQVLCVKGWAMAKKTETVVLPRSKLSKLLRLPGLT